MGKSAVLDEAYRGICHRPFDSKPIAIMRDWPNEREDLKFRSLRLQRSGLPRPFSNRRAYRAGRLVCSIFILKQAAAFRHLMGLLPAASVVRTE